MSSYQAQALETVATPAGTFSNTLHVREQRGSGYVRDVWYASGVGMIKMTDATSAAVLTGYTIPGAVAQVPRRSVCFMRLPAAHNHGQ